MLQADNSTVYIKRLIKIIYEKEKQIEQLKKIKIKNNENAFKAKPTPALEQQIKNDIDFTSTQIRAATQQMAAMENTIAELQSGLDEESLLNAQLEADIARLKEQNQLLTNQLADSTSQKLLIEKDTSLNHTVFLLGKEENKILKNQKGKFQKQLSVLRKKAEIESEKLLCLNSILKRYEQFAYEIGSLIQASYTKHCPQASNIKSSKKMIKDSDNPSQKLEDILARFTLIQNWACSLESRLENFQGGHEVNNETVEGISMIVRSFENKLNYCEMTGNQGNGQDNDIELQRNEQMLLQNLQRQCEQSLYNDRSKVVELEEMKLALKMTKQINNKLYDDLNQNEFIISQFRQSFPKLCLKAKTRQSTKQLEKLSELLGLNVEQK